MASAGPMVRALAAAFKAADLPDRYAATKALARRYAALLDEARDSPTEDQSYEVLGPKLLQALTALGLTAAGSKQGGGTGGSTGSKVLDELRAARERRAAG